MVPPDFDASVIDEFRANGGVVGGMFEGRDLLLLHHRGARTGAERVSPLAYVPDDGRYVIIASKGGAPDNPAWYHNLKANPRARIEVGDETLEVTAHEATGPERDRLYAQMVRRAPAFAEYENKTERIIPVIVLVPDR